MKKRSLRIREVVEAEIRFGKRWLADAQRQLAMAEDNMKEVGKLLAGDEEPSEEAAEVIRESVNLLDDARERVKFYDGVLAGMLAMERAIRERVALDDMGPFSPDRI